MTAQRTLTEWPRQGNTWLGAKHEWPDGEAMRPNETQELANHISFIWSIFFLGIITGVILVTLTLILIRLI